MAICGQREVSWVRIPALASKATRKRALMLPLRMGHGKSTVGEILTDRIWYTTWHVTPCTSGQTAWGVSVTSLCLLGVLACLLGTTVTPD